MSDSSTNPNRRNFLAKSGAAAAGASLLGNLAVPSAVHAAGGDQLRVGLIGCGGRGSGAAVNALKADPGAVLTAVGDAFQDRAENRLKSLKGQAEVKDRVLVEKDQIFVGFDAFKKVIDSGVDIVILATPPHFRPEHLKYAVKAGKHCFVEKPVAVDAPGVRDVIETCKEAEAKRLAVVSGLCWRYHPGVKATMNQILAEKAIGDIVAIQSSYNAGTLWHRGRDAAWSPMEYQMRNWLYYTWLSGDHIVEQAVHSLDKCAWLLGDSHPVKAFGLGGRQQRTDPKYGHIFDHHTVFFEFADGVRVNFTCRQQVGCSNHVDETVLGTRGQARILAHRIEGENSWRYRGPKPNMYDEEHREMFKSIRAGSPINNGHFMANSSMLSIMGRMCTYTGKNLTWEQCFNSEERLGPKEYAWTDVPEPPVAIPGVTKFA